MRQCPLTPCEVERLEASLQALLHEVSPAELTPVFLATVAHRSAGERAQVLDALHGGNSTVRWQAACRQVVETVLDGICRIQGPRLVGRALYAAAHHVAGTRGVEALYWSQQTQTAAGLLAQHAWTPWLRWLCQLPLPSLRGGGWLEPVLAALPAGVHTGAGTLRHAHGVLAQALAPPSSPLTGVLLATVWVLWARAGPTHAAGSRLPEVLEDLDALGRAARRLLEVPLSVQEDSLAAGVLPAAAAVGAALWRTSPPDARRAAPLAAVGLALASARGAGAIPAAPADAVEERVRVIDAVWSAWESRPTTAGVDLSNTAFTAMPDGPFARCQSRVHRVMATLYRQDDFLGRLYDERVPPGTLRLRNGTLAGRRIPGNADVRLDPPADPDAASTWASPTRTLLDQLQQAAACARGCYDNAGPQLGCALQVHLDGAAPEVAFDAQALAGLVLQLEGGLPDDDAATAAQERANLRWLQDQLRIAEASPVRGLAPTWAAWRPPPRSHLGHNLALARRWLHQLAGHPNLTALCAAQGADPADLEVTAQGDVSASALEGKGRRELFNASTTPTSLVAWVSPLRGLAAMLRSPIRASGRMQVPELLAYYGIAWPAEAPQDRDFAAAMSALARRLGASPGPAPTGATEPPDCAADARAIQQAVVDQLWQLFDQTPAGSAIALDAVAFDSLPSAPVATVWAEAQQRLLALFEAPPLWLTLRQADASFHHLRLSQHHVSADLRGSERTLRINMTAVERESADIAPLYALASRLGCVRPADGVPLDNVLAFHNAMPVNATSPCRPPPLYSPAQRLQLLHRLHVQWSPSLPELTPFARDTADLQALLPQLDAVALDASGSYRPTLATGAGAAAHAALGPFALLLDRADVADTLAGLTAAPRYLSVDSAGMLTAHLDNGAVRHLSLSHLAHNASALAPVIDLLASHAARLGGVVRSDGRVEALRLLAAHGGCGPQDGMASDAMRRCAERLLGELRLGMRPHLVSAQDLLDAPLYARLREATGTFLGRDADSDMTLLEYLGTPLVQAGRFQWDQPHRARFFASEMALTPRALTLQADLLDALGWHGHTAAAPTSPTLLASLTLAALVADLGPPSQPDARVVLGYRLHKHANRGRTFAEVRADFQTYLSSLGRLPAALQSMATTLALLEALPELIADDIPPTLLFGSPIAAANYVSGVHLAERIRRGFSQQMNFTGLVALSGEFAGNLDVPTDVRKMALDARLPAMRDWVHFRDLVLPLPRNATGEQRFQAAMETFDARVMQIEAAVEALLVPPPYRMPLVEAELKRVFPRFPGVLAGLSWNDTRLRLCNDREWLRLSFPLHELVAAGALQSAPYDWSLCPVPDPHVSRGQDHQQLTSERVAANAALQAGFANLTDVNARFQEAFARYFEAAQAGYGTLIEEAVYLRPPDEQEALAGDEVEIFTVRTHEPDLEAAQETPADTDPHRGRFGVIYRIGRNGSRRCFQLFPLQSRIVPLALDGELPLNGVLKDRRVRLRHGHYATIQVRRGTPLALDWNAYATYARPRAPFISHVIVEPLRVNASRANAPPLRHSRFPALVRPIQQDFFWLDADAFLHEARGANSFEAHLAAPPLWLRAVEFFVPFVANVREMSSTDRQRFAMAAFGLYLEGWLILGPLANGVVKLLYIPGMKALPRFAELSRVLGRNALDALNPLAGSLALSRLGVSVVQRGLHGDLHFVWSRLRHPPTQTGEWQWITRGGMAVLSDDAARQRMAAAVEVRTVQGVRDVLVVAHTGSGAGSQDQRHLFDPATLTPYGPLLQPAPDSSSAAGMLLKVGEGLRPPRPSPGKALKPLKQGTRTSQEQTDERVDPHLPPALDLTR